MASLACAPPIRGGADIATFGSCLSWAIEQAGQGIFIGKPPRDMFSRYAPSYFSALRKEYTP
jgi:hypothetical protein